MYTYKRVIRTPHSIEIEFYQSIREIGKYYGGRGIRRGVSAPKLKAANKLRAVRRWERVIDCNFGERDFFCRFSAPYGTFCEERDFRREINNWFKRIKRRCAQQGIEFKYIGFIECGKSGKNWHAHIILNRTVAFIAQECWHYKNGGVNLAPLYSNHEYEKLAEYIRKDVLGCKRMMASRNLRRPEESVKRATRKEIKRLEKGDGVENIEGWYRVDDESYMLVNEVTGVKWHFRFRPLRS